MQYKKKPKVAVFMVTYNHELYLEQAIESVLMQRTDFPFKLFIGEDCSTDGTRRICLNYKKAFPDKIELLLNQTNLGGVANAINVYKSCFDYGEYTAMCEGDDYWISTNKLQKHIDFLEKSTNYAGVATNAKRYVESANTFESEEFYENLKPGVNKDLTLKTLLQGFLIHTATLTFRNHLFDPQWLRGYSFGDKFLQYLICSRGKICFFNERDAVYRVHKAGAMHVIIPQNFYKYFKDQFDFLTFLNIHTNFEYDSLIRKKKSVLKIMMNLANKEKSVSVKFINGFKYFTHKDSHFSFAELNNIFTIAFPQRKLQIKRIIGR